MSSTWQAKNPEKWLDYKRAYYEKNREAIAACKKAWAERNRDHLLAQRRARAGVEAAQRAQSRDRLRPNELLRGAKRRAKRDGIPFQITVADIQIPDRCPLLDVPLTAGAGRLCANSPSLDRKDNSLGYVPGNVWVISYRANAAKGNLSADELMMLATRLKATLAEGAVS